MAFWLAFGGGVVVLFELGEAAVHGDMQTFRVGHGVSELGHFDSDVVCPFAVEAVEATDFIWGRASQNFTENHELVYLVDGFSELRPADFDDVGLDTLLALAVAYNFYCIVRCVQQFWIRFFACARHVRMTWWHSCGSAE